MKSLGDIVNIDVESVKVFVSRKRDRAEFEGVRASIEQIGLKMPIQVRDISERPKDERKREGGGFYKYELIVGEGRILAHRELGKKKIAAFIVDAPESEIVGRFLAENMVRKPLPWAEKGRMIKAEMDAGQSIEQVAAMLHISVQHAFKLYRIVNRSAPEIADEVAALPSEEASALTSLRPDHQVIVVEALRENPERQVREVLKKAKELTESGQELSTLALKKSLERVGEDLKRTRETLKLTRLHHSLGPLNVVTLLENPAIRKALEAEGVNIAKFESLLA